MWHVRWHDRETVRLQVKYLSWSRIHENHAWSLHVRPEPAHDVRIEEWTRWHKLHAKAHVFAWLSVLLIEASDHIYSF